MSLLAPLLRPPRRPSAPFALQLPIRAMGNWITCEREGGGKRSAQRRCSRDDVERLAVVRRRKAPSVEDVFIGSLVAAGTCRAHRRTHDGQQRHRRGGVRQQRSFSTRSPPRNEAVASPDDEPKVTQQDYQRLVDIYPAYTPMDQRKRTAHEQSEQRSHVPLAPRLFLTAEQESRPPRVRWHVLTPENGEHALIIRSLTKLCACKPGTIKLDRIWRLYQSVPNPRPRHLGPRVMHRMLKHLGFVEAWDQKEAMQRHLQVLHECEAEGIPLQSRHWTTAVSFAGRWLRRTTSAEVRRAIETWMLMEQHGHLATHATFNVLLDVSVKAGRFALADTIFEELKARNMPLDRTFRASMIYYAGARRDGDGVRKAFKEFVEAGEIVDTVIMNSVISGLLKAGEAPGAELVFQRMKHLHAEKFGTKSLRDWRAKKEMRTLLSSTAYELREQKQHHEASFFGSPFSSDDKREEIQKAAPIAPDADTYMIFIKYHSYISGDIDQIWEFIGEMKEQDLRVHGSAYLNILYGFRAHGGYPFTAWNHRRLEELWQQILSDVAQHLPPQEVNAASDTVSEYVPEAQQTPTGDEGKDFEADDDAQYDFFQTYGPIECTNEEDNSDGASPSPPPQQTPVSEVDDFDMLGAMMIDHSASVSQFAEDPKDKSLIIVPVDLPEPIAGLGEKDADSAFLQTLSADGAADDRLVPGAQHSAAPYAPIAAELTPPHVIHEQPSEDPFQPSDAGFASFDPSETTSSPFTSEPSGSFENTSDSTGSTGDQSEDADQFHYDTPPISEKDRPPYLTTSFGVAVIRAFYHCCGKQRMLEVWEQDIKRGLFGRVDGCIDDGIDWFKIEAEVQKCRSDAEKYVDEQDQD